MNSCVLLNSLSVLLHLDHVIVQLFDSDLLVEVQYVQAFLLPICLATLHLRIVQSSIGILDEILSKLAHTFSILILGVVAKYTSASTWLNELWL